LVGGLALKQGVKRIIVGPIAKEGDDVANSNVISLD
jgi:hypothetical protein